MKSDYFDQLKATLQVWPAWYYYALQDIKQIFQIVIGPLWITISVAVTIFAMGPLYKIIFNIRAQAILYISYGVSFLVLDKR